MANPQVSPISQLLLTLGITREDLSKRSDQMRQFLNPEQSTPSRVVDRDAHHRSRSNSDLPSRLRSSSTSSSIARSISRNSSTSFRDSTPPITPIKSEVFDNGVPARQYNSMELVIERQRRQNKKERRTRKERERELSRNAANPPSPSPSNTSSQPSVSLDSFMQSRDGGRALLADDEDGALPIITPKQSIAPVTPQKSKYYREHTEFNSTSRPGEEITRKIETPTSARMLSASNPQSISHHQYYPYSAYGSYVSFSQDAEASTSTLPVTPQAKRTHLKVFKSPLPPSSPPPSSPPSSPSCAINLVSSPGPIGPAPQEEEYDNLPYTLPPGPYSTNKPDLSYAALVGQAILSSPEHRLTLQEIYDWITIVYPYFKRGETTWMNSIRHVLSTTVCFRKVPRDRSVGRTQWAIWDEDLECFKGGNFRKHLCKDYMKQAAAKDKQTKGKSRVRKRTDTDDADLRKSKRPRKDQVSSPLVASVNSQYPASFAPLFPPTRPTPHHQPYYQSCLSQTPNLPADIIFPPLPAASAFNRVLNRRNENAPQSSASSSTSSNRAISPPQTISSSSYGTPTSSASSVPGLTPNRQSSSSPSMPATSDMDVEGANSVCTVAGADSQQGELEQIDGDDVLPLSGGTTLKPVRFWSEPNKSNALEPGIKLLDSSHVVPEDEDSLLKSKKESQRAVSATQFPPFLLYPTSPTPERRAVDTIPPVSNAEAGPSNQPRTPTPSTPPTGHTNLSSFHTPLSHKGLHMSPTASLAHYKTNLEPPPVIPFDSEGESDPLRTPRKRKTSLDGLLGNPTTPRKMFNPNAIDSPYRTPNGFQASPFSRTPRARPILDPQDPRTLLDDELNRMGTLSDSPGGLFGKSRSSLLYDSPGALDLPGKYRTWW
ncbi:transcriptional regulator family: Forkhead [Agaricus bisporus var. burnettii]|uniref:Transcriptional regulator family: Forkhead n=1 Tax=Agaricus bisporus var. burnettii TaxID=192524 RepID=A0A8H7CAH6_AGABI|nr:transcriptional regulator family: Forkhead [Agaricus bisporus var. burnettii]